MASENVRSSKRNNPPQGRVIGVSDQSSDFAYLTTIIFKGQVTYGEKP
jgi:hypothetical protein